MSVSLSWLATPSGSIRWLSRGKPTAGYDDFPGPPSPFLRGPIKPGQFSPLPEEERVELKYGLISVDDHVQETPDTWTNYMSTQKWGDLIPHLEEQADGSQVWMVEGRTVDVDSVAETGAIMADRNQTPRRWDQVPQAAYVPSQRLRAMDADGVDCQVLYPSVAGASGEVFGRIQDPALELACIQAYNNWLIDEWRGHSDRFVPQCLVPIHSPQAAADEVSRAVALGHRGVVMPSTPWDLKDVPHVNEADWDPLWATCQDLEVPVCFHSGSSAKVRLQAWEGFSPVLTAAMNGITGPVSSVPILANLLFSRILTRFPTLKFVFAETSLAWGAYQIETADHQFERQRLHNEGYQFKPSELFRRQCYMTGWYDRAGLKVRHYLGVENILWESNFPRANSSWPNTRQYVERSFAGIPAGERSMMLTGNAAKLYKL